MHIAYILHLPYLNMQDSGVLRKKLLYKSWHRGCKETDILLGNFAIANINSFSNDQLLQYEKIVNTDDVVLYNWLTGKVSIPEEFDNSVFQQIVKFHAS